MSFSPLSMPTITVTAAETGLTVLAALQRHLPAIAPAYLRQLLKSGKILADGTPCHADERITAGTLLHLPDSARLQALLAAAPPPLSILFENREVLIVTKPSGLAVHAAPGHETDNLTCRVEALLLQRRERFQVAPIHRLDLETSGPVLFGKGRMACGELGKLFMRQQVVKLYLGLAAGHTPEQGELRSPVPAKGAWKEALSSFSVVTQNHQASLLSLQIFSGRQHQIRRQLSDYGHPLFGDQRYGGPCPRQLPRLFLHCCTLSFTDPFNATAITVHAPLPDDLTPFLTLCGLTLPEPELCPASP